jgi:N-acetylmuramoyl-L-alanine amidase
MRIGNRKRFLFSCIFFTMTMLLFGKAINPVYEKVLGEPYSPMVKAIDKNNKFKKPIREYTIVLDAGHGGIDNGTSYKDMYEKYLTFKIVKYAEAYLKDKGCKVVLTRNEDKLIPLKKIGEKVNEANADAFISIHINSINDITFKGITTYYYDAKGYQKDERMKLAQIIEKEAIKDDGWENKGIRRENFAVLRYSKIPCVLVECGFITNEEDREKLSKEDALKRLAENISNGTIEYLESVK